MWPGVISRFAGSNARMARSSCGPNMSGLRASSEARLRLSALLRRYGPAYLSFGRFSEIGICGRVIAVQAPPLFRTDRWMQGAAKDAATHVLDLVGGSGGRGGPTVQGARHGAQAL